MFGVPRTRTRRHRSLVAPTSRARSSARSWRLSDSRSNRSPTPVQQTRLRRRCQRAPALSETPQTSVSRSSRRDRPCICSKATISSRATISPIEFCAIVDEGLHAFNVQTFYANEASNVAARDQLIGELLSAARTLPMMSPRRVLIVHEAERLLSPKREGR